MGLTPRREEIGIAGGSAIRHNLLLENIVPTLLNITKFFEVMSMRIRHAGKIRENLWFLGREESCVYLLEGGRESMIISGGMSYLVPDLLRQFQTFGIDEKGITKLLILHAHFDHVGIVPYFKRRHPEMEVLASARGWEILQMPKAMNTINQFSRSVAERMKMEEVYDTFDLDWRPGITGTTVSEGDHIDLGNLEIHIYETPGHSSCSISAYVPRLKALFASDAGGMPYKETNILIGNSNFTQFQESLQKLKGFDVEYLCADHYGYVTGDEAKDFISRGIELAKQNRALLEEAYLRTGDIDRAAWQIISAFYKENPDYIISPEIFEGVHRQVLRHIASNMKESAEPEAGKT